MQADSRLRILWLTKAWEHHVPRSGYWPMGSALTRNPKVRVLMLDQEIVRRATEPLPLIGRIIKALIKFDWRDARYLLSAPGKLRQARDFQPDVVHVSAFEEGPWAIQNARKYFPGAKISASFHQPVFHWEASGVSPDLVDISVFLAQRQRDAAHPALLTKPNLVVPHGIDIQFFTPENNPRSNHDVVFLGIWLRDFTVLEAAMREVLYAKAEARFQLFIPSAPHAETFLRVFAPYGDRVRVALNAPAEELLRTLRSSRLMILPLTDNTANNAMLEGMACGLPLVATDVGGVREYVSAECAILTPVGDAHSMAQAVLQLLNDDALCRRMRSAARKTAERFSWDRVAASFVEGFLNFRNGQSARLPENDKVRS